MNDYISREAAKRAIMSQYLSRANKTKYADVIDVVPAAEVEPVRHGRWIVKIIRGDKRSVCSECLLETGTCYEENYCPNCGARMDGDGE